MTFWCLSFFNNKHLVAPSGAGLIFIPVPASPASTAGGGDSPSYRGFFHCLAVFDNQSSPYFSSDSLLLCTGFFSTGILSCVALVHPMQPFSSTYMVNCSPALFHVQVHRYYILNTTKFSFYSVRLITPCSISWIPFICLLEHPSTPASGTLPTEQQYNGHLVNTLFILSTHHCLSLLIAFNTLFLSGLPLFSPVVDVIHL